MCYYMLRFIGDKRTEGGPGDLQIYRCKKYNKIFKFKTKPNQIILKGREESAFKSQISPTRSINWT